MHDEVDHSVALGENHSEHKVRDNTKITETGSERLGVDSADGNSRMAEAKEESQWRHLGSKRSEEAIGIRWEGHRVQSDMHGKVKDSLPR